MSGTISRGLSLLCNTRILTRSLATSALNKPLPLKPVRTPLMNEFKIENEALNQAIIEEWKGKIGKAKKVELSTMNLTALAYEAIDNPFEQTREIIVEEILKFLDFDSLRFRSPEDQDLLDLQTKHWNPMIEWFDHQFDCNLTKDSGRLMDVTPVPTIIRERVRDSLLLKSRWPLVGVKFMSENLKSYILAASLMEQYLSVQQAVELSRLETTCQLKKWARVEWDHDIDEQCTLSRVAAGSLFYHLTS